MSLQIAIIGGGAAGFFSAIHIAERLPNANVTIYEGSNKVLAKVLVSGGGRCNVTNRISDPTDLVKNYPRGHDFLTPVFEKFSSTDTQAWFTLRGVPLKTEEDGRVFPTSDSSLSIYNCLTQTASQLGVTVNKGQRLTDFSHNSEQWHLHFGNEKVLADILVLATGSNPAIYDLLKDKVNIVAPVPSLFTFKATNHALVELSGISVENGTVKIAQINTSGESGPLLITHKGYSGPAILRLSAWHARELAELNYKCTLYINWGSYNTKELAALLKSYAESRPKEKVTHWKEHGLPKRLWQHIFEKCELREFTNWSELGKKGIAKILQQLCSYAVPVEGKNTFKEEFVTAGGIDLAEVDAPSMHVKNHPNLYAAGEVLNIDAITGGFNFQAAWSEAYCLAEAIAQQEQNV